MSPTRPSDVVYEIPFDTNRHLVEVVQGFHGPFGHNRENKKPYRDLSFGVDFGLPIGTKVRVAREGVVRAILDCNDQYYLGNEPLDPAAFTAANFVSVDQLDGTIGLYVHLVRGSIRVKMGQQVAVGDVLASTGLSGWVGDIPNLHFQVYRDVVDRGFKRMQSIPVSFRGYQGPLEHAELFPAPNKS
jgi:murein DD-endopeptidase MepM/ murein hydrolase activator NlpD